MARRTVYVPDHLNKQIDDEMPATVSLSELFNNAVHQKLQEVRAARAKGEAA